MSSDSEDDDVEVAVASTSLVDQRCCFGELKYPDLTLYTVFAIIEKVYSTMTHPTNFELFGGVLLVKICNGMLDNQTLLALFTDLFPVGKFGADTIQTTMQYYLKVFGNVRVKDLVFRYNSNIIKGNTVGLRQGLAAGCRGQKTEKDTNQPPKKKSKKHDDDSYNPEDDNESDDDDSFVYDVDINAEEEHKILQELADMNIDQVETYLKNCTDPENKEEHMGKALLIE